MASRIQVFGCDDDALFWDPRPLDDAAARHDEPVTESEPPTVRSAREILDVFPSELPAQPDGSGIVSVQTPEQAGAVLEDVDVDIEVSFELDEEEPCPETLRSPVSDGVSPSVRRARVA